MKRFTHGNTEVWVGVHPKMGVLIFDPHAQIDVAQDKVRLYVWSERRMATFLKSIVKDRLAQGDSQPANMESLKESARFYCDLRGRHTHCYSCRRDLNSIDFELCGVCGWIRCECDACGCGYLV